MFRMQQSNQYPIRLKFTVFNSILTHFVSFITGDTLFQAKNSSTDTPPPF